MFEPFNVYYFVSKFGRHNLLKVVPTKSPYSFFLYDKHVKMFVLYKCLYVYVWLRYKYFFN